MSQICELFGLLISDCGSAQIRQALQTQACPYRNGKICYKVRKSNANQAIGTCSLIFDSISQPAMICPEPFAGQKRIFIDCLPILNQALLGSNLYLIPEVRTPVGRIDYVLAAERNGEVIDFAGIEIQSLDTCGSIWAERNKLLASLGLLPETSKRKDADQKQTKGCAVNWKMSSKTILSQIMQKSQLFSSMNKKLVLVCQTPLYDYMKVNFDFSLVKNCRDEDVLHFHVYDYLPDQLGMKLLLHTTCSTDLDGIRTILGHHPESSISLEQMKASLQSRLKPEYLFNPVENESSFFSSVYTRRSSPFQLPLLEEDL